LIQESRAFAYSNLMLIFAVLIALGGAVYFYRYGRRQEPAQSANGG